MKLKKFISDEFKNISKKFYYQNTEQNTENICNSFEDKKVEQKIMISSRFFDKNLENKNIIKKMDLFAQQNEDVNNIDNNSIQSNNIIYKKKKENKCIYQENRIIQIKTKIIVIFLKIYLKIKIIQKVRIYFYFKIIIIILSQK